MKAVLLTVYDLGVPSSTGPETARYRGTVAAPTLSPGIWLMVCLRKVRFHRLYCAVGSLAARVLLALSAPLAVAQNQAAPTQAPSVSGAEVSLCILLRAKHNSQLSTLKTADLALVDAGRPIDSREMRLAPIASQEPLVTFIFDRLRPATARNAARDAERMLSGFGAHPMLLGVWSMGPQLRVIQPYVDSKSAISKTFPLAAAASTVEPKPGAALAPVLDAPADSISGAILGEAGHLISGSSWTYATLLAAAHVQRQRPGRKAVVLFTEQPNLGGNSADRYRELPEALRDANISLFVIDANALDDAASNQAMLTIAMGGQTATNYYAGLATQHSINPLDKTQGMAPLQFQAMKDTIATLEAGGPGDHANLLAQAAQASGGAYLFADASTKKLTRQLLAGLDDYVTVTYRVAAGQQDGRFHPVAVRSVRPDIAIAAQPGYFATSPLAANGARYLDAPAAPVLEADPALLEAGAIDAGLQLKAAVLRFGHASSGAPTVVAIEIPLPQLHLEEDEHTRLFALHATVAMELIDADGKPIARFQQEFHRRGAIESEPTLAGQVLSLQRQFTLPAGDYTLHATVRDWNTNTFGKTAQHVAVNATDEASPLGDQISDLVIVRSVDRVGAEASPTALQYGDRQVVPSLSGQLAPGTTKASLYFQLYNPLGNTSAGRPVRALSLLLSKDGKPLATLPLPISEARLDGISTHLFNVALNRGPGRYDIAVDLKQGSGSVTRHASLLLPPPDPTSANPTEDAGEKAADTFVASREIAVELGINPATVPALSASQSDALLDAARENALTYTGKLPNFICRETISRATDRSGTGANWKPRDTIVETLHFQDRVEQRTVLEIDGQKSSLPADRIEGARSNGEFGTLLRAIFDPVAKARFTWLQSEQRNGDLLQVFRFNVPFETSSYIITDHTNTQLRAAFHGLVVVDTATRAVRRLFLQTEGLPRDFGVKSSWIAMNYDYVQINGHDYLLPSRGEVGLQQGKHDLVLNRIDFSQYRRFGARSRLVLPAAPEPLH